jgi:hypothetical protein
MSVWVRSVAFLPGESISSWMIRAALAQGCDPLTLTGSLWPRWRVWTLDVDRGLDADTLLVAAKVSGIAPSVFEQSGLRIDAEKIAGRQLDGTGTWPWILTLGSRNRKRLAGMQYCPMCLAVDNTPYFRREWRFAWQTACLQHDTRLIERCWSCDVLVTPHRLVAEDGHLARCAWCKADLRLAQRMTIQYAAKDFQGQAQAVMAASSGSFDGQILSAHRWFELAKFCAGLVRYSVRNDTSCLSAALRYLGVPMASVDSPVFITPFEQLPTAQREMLFANVCHLLSFTRYDFIDAFKSAGVSQNSLRAIDRNVPDALSTITDQLAINNRVRQKGTCVALKPKSKRTVKIMWARFLRKMGMRLNE